MHFIWKHRCKVVFDNITPNTNDVIKVRSSVHSTWHPPYLNFLKINIDAYFSPQSLLYGIGNIIKNHAGEYAVGQRSNKKSHLYLSDKSFGFIKSYRNGEN